MANARRNRDRRPARRKPFRDPKPTILIVCEGEVTEQEYFRGFRSECRNPRVKIEIANAHGVPRTLVEKAKEYMAEAKKNAAHEKDDYLAYDSVWCVFDVDEHPGVADAQQMARDNGIQTAISNPCFELWLLLHFRDNPGMQHRDKIHKMLAELVPGFDKHVNFVDYIKGYPEAAKRAQRMDKAAEAAGESNRNPSTGVYRLTELIRDENVEKESGDLG